MGLIRGGLLVVVSVLLFVVFLAGNVLWTLDKSLDYETIKPELVSIVKEVIEDEININEVVGEEFEKMQVYCLNNSEYVFSHDESGRVFEVGCEVVAQGSDAVIEHAIEDFVEEIYHGKAEESMFDFAKLKESINSYFYIALAAALVLFVLVFFLAEAKSNSFIIAGSLLVISSLPFIKIEQFLFWVPFGFAKHFTVFFSKAYTVFLISLITGLIVLGIGIVMKFFGVGFKLFDFFSKIKSKEKVVKKQSSMKDKVVSGKPVNAK
ncbi:hypothetical protein KAT80_03540 [Candidatus Pacearchaeota archaeon]|nr:hypothetical protein [Candidatus Pacearchaeota archaeon]